MDGNEVIEYAEEEEKKEEENRIEEVGGMTTIDAVQDKKEINEEGVVLE